MARYPTQKSFACRQPGEWPNSVLDTAGTRYVATRQGVAAGQLGR